MNFKNIKIKTLNIILICLIILSLLITSGVVAFLYLGQAKNINDKILSTAQSMLNVETADYNDSQATNFIKNSVNNIQDLKSFFKVLAETEDKEVYNNALNSNDLSTKQQVFISLSQKMQTLLDDELAKQQNDYTTTLDSYTTTQSLNIGNIENANRALTDIYLLSINIKTEVYSTLVDLILNLQENTDSLITYFTQTPAAPEYLQNLQTLRTTEDKTLSDWHGKIIDFFQAKNQYFTNKNSLTTAENKKAEIEKRKVELASAPAAKNNSAKFIYISITDQKLYAYEYGVPVMMTVVTTGKDKSPTVTGHFSVYYKSTQTHLKGYDTNNHYYDVLVNYWMAFYQDFGIHDTPTPTNYGGSDFHVRGSLGCVRTPLSIMDDIYAWADVGTPVWVE